MAALSSLNQRASEVKDEIELLRSMVSSRMTSSATSLNLPSMGTGGGHSGGASGNLNLSLANNRPNSTAGALTNGNKAESRSARSTRVKVEQSRAARASWRETVDRASRNPAQVSRQQSATMLGVTFPGNRDGSMVNGRVPSVPGGRFHKKAR
uniref:Uncharacterized protein n=1 Tax=Florenciella parvula TaxID=236787 RepID=A0A7S2C9G4_9STRA